MAQAKSKKPLDVVLGYLQRHVRTLSQGIESDTFLSEYSESARFEFWL